MWELVILAASEGSADGWWDMSSFFPDLIVGLATGAIVGLFVLFAERQLTSRSRRNRIADLQGLAVERARTVLRFGLRFRSIERSDLHLDPIQLDGLRTALRDVPAGEPADMVPGYHWATQTLDQGNDFEAIADAIDSRVADKWARKVDHIDVWIRMNILEMSTAPFQMHSERTWRWHPDHKPKVTNAIENDDELLSLVTQYIWARRLMLANREGFLKAVEIWRRASWEATHPHSVEEPKNPVARLRIAAQRRRSLRLARTRADHTAGGIVMAAIVPD